MCWSVTLLRITNSKKKPLKSVFILVFLTSEFENIIKSTDVVKLAAGKLTTHTEQTFDLNLVFVKIQK